MGDFADRMKSYEPRDKAERGLPLLARLDGRSFSRFTRHLTKPFDHRLTELMRNTTVYLMNEFGASIGYTQSDEITVGWVGDSDFPFDGRFQKLASILAAACTGYFTRQLPEMISEKSSKAVMFDARVYQVPSLQEMHNVIKWREGDAVKNSITMAASELFSHKQLQGVSGETKLEWLRERGQPWEDLKDRFKRGSFFVRAPGLRMLTDVELEAIPPQYRPTAPIVRSTVKEVHDFCDFLII